MNNNQINGTDLQLTMVIFVIINFAIILIILILINRV